MTEVDLLLVSPHRFPDMHRESALARDHGLILREARSQAELDALAEHARVIMMTPFADLTDEVINSARGLQGIVRYGVGYDNLAVEAATARGIPVGNVPAAATEEVAISAFTMGLSLVRRMAQADRLVRAGSWDSAFMAGVPRISELTVGVVGLGRIGRKTAGYWASVAGRIVVHDPVASSTPYLSIDLDELLTVSDVVSLHPPLTPETSHFMSQERLRSMKPGAVLVNVARGGLVDEAALVECLLAGHLGGAAIDVFEYEPVPQNHPLLTAPRTLLSAHLTWRSDPAVADYQRMAVEAARATLTGLPMPHCINGTRRDAEGGREHPACPL